MMNELMEPTRELPRVDEAATVGTPTACPCAYRGDILPDMSQLTGVAEVVPGAVVLQVPCHSCAAINSIEVHHTVRLVSRQRRE